MTTEEKIETANVEFQLRKESIPFNPKGENPWLFRTFLRVAGPRDERTALYMSWMLREKALLLQPPNRR